MDAALFHLHAHVLAQLVVEAAQNIFAAIDEAHFGAEAGKDAGELDGDVTAALNQNAFGEFRKVEHLVRRNDVLDAGDRRAEIGR